MEFCAPIAHSVAGGTLVASDNVVYTNSWTLVRKNFFGVEVKFTSDTDVNVKVELEQSNYKETSAGVADSNFVVATDTLATITDENVHLLPVAPIVTVYARLKLTGLYTGLASNSVTTVLDRANWTEVEA